MDDPALDPAEHARALAGLARINRLDRAGPRMWRTLRRLAAANGSAPLRVLDVATGSGDLVVDLARRAQRASVGVQMDGCDLSPRAVAAARGHADRAGVASTFFGLDAHGEDLPEGYDVVTCSLFMHHLTEAEATGLLRRMKEAARQAVIVSDLRRSPAALCLFLFSSRLATTSRVVHTDAIRSVRAAFTPAEFAALAGRAGLRGARIERAGLARFALTWERVNGR